MKTGNVRTCLLIAVVALFFVALPAVGEQEYGSDKVAQKDAWTYHPVGTTINGWGPLSMCEADINRDGRRDVVIAKSYWDEENEVAWFENPEDPEVPWTKHVIAAPSVLTVFTGVDAIDVNGDGPPDVITASPSGETLMWYENSGDDPPTWTPHQVPQTKSDVGLAKGMGPSVYATYLSPDSAVDIVWGGTAYLAWYENDGASPPSWTEHMIGSSLFLNGGTSVADLYLPQSDYRGILLAGSGQGQLALYVYDETEQSWDEFIVDTTPSNIWCVSSAWIDSYDDSWDILADSYWYENDGGSPPSFTPHFIGPVTWTHAADLNGDLHRDIVGVKSPPGEVYWYESDGGSPPSWTEHFVYGPADVILPMDVDYGNDIDIVIGNSNSDNIGWLENTMYTCGDASGDGVIDVGDIVFEINYLYRNGDAPDPILSGDATCDQLVDIGDVVYLVNYLYKAGDEPGC